VEVGGRQRRDMDRRSGGGGRAHPTATRGHETKLSEAMKKWGPCNR
jgi:hypothetical protein